MPRSGSGGRRATWVGVLVAGLAVALAAGGAWRGRGRLAGWLSARSPETQVGDALRRLDRLRLAVDGADVELHPVRVSDPVVAAEDGRATAIALVEADGRIRWRGGDVALAFVGRERLRLVPCASAGWCLDERRPLERLAGVLAALLARAREDAGARVLAWQLRIERDGAEVGEDRERGGGADAAGDGGFAAGGRERRVYRLSREAERWVFTGS